MGHLDILECMASGYSVPEIGKKLGIIAPYPQIRRLANRYGYTSVIFPNKGKPLRTKDFAPIEYEKLCKFVRTDFKLSKMSGKYEYEG